MNPAIPLTLTGVLAFPFMVVQVAGQTAEDIVRRHIAALGGAEALAAVQTMEYVRTVQNTEAGVTTVQSRTVFRTRRPFFYRSERPESGSFYVSDGVSAWSGRRRTDNDAIEWSEPRVVLAARDTDFDRPFGSFIGYDEKGNVATYLGENELHGVVLQTVRMLWQDGTEWDFYFQPSSGLCYGWDASPGEPGGLIRVDDYRRVGTVLIPHRNVVADTLADGTVRIHERLYSDFEINPEFPEGLFRPGQNSVSVRR